MKDLAYVESKLRESGVLDGLNAATPSEAVVVAQSHREWALRLAPYFLKHDDIDVETALRLYRLDNEGPQHPH